MSRVPYASVVNSLMYAMVCIRPNIVHVPRSIEQVYVKTREGELDISEMGFRYLHDTNDYSLCCQGRDSM